MFTEKEISEHEKEISRRRELPPLERAKLDKEDQKKLHARRTELAGKVEGRIKERTKLAASIQNDITALALKLKKFTEQDIETYQMLWEPDALFSDCPISHGNTYRWAKEFMVKKDMDFIGVYVPDGKPSIKNFGERMEESSAWALRFTKEKELPKQGLDAII